MDRVDKITQELKIPDNSLTSGRGDKRDQEVSTERFLRILFGGDLGSQQLVIWTKRDRQSQFFSGDEIGGAAQAAKAMANEMDVYFGVGLLKEQPSDGGRGRSDTVSAIPGVWLDLDIQGPNHASRQLPKSKEVAMGLLHGFTLKPTMVVSTGGGLHVYWLFKEPMLINSATARAEAKDMSERFQGSFITAAAQRGWSIDNTSNLSRILRLPGTYNHKQDAPVKVEVLNYDEGSRYDPVAISEAIREFIVEEARNAGGHQPDILEGARNTTLTSIGGTLRTNQCEYEEIYQDLLAINRSRCVPPLPDDEVEQIARSVAGYPAGEDCEGGQTSQADRILTLSDSMGLFHTSDKEAYADISVKDLREIWPLKSKETRLYLSKAYYDRYNSSPGSQGLQNALETLQGKALFDAPEKDVFIRLAKVDAGMCIDLCNDAWEKVGVSAEGWSIVKDSPVPFRRPKSLLALPNPVLGGNIDGLRRIINVRNQNEWILIVSWIIGAFSPVGPYPLLLLHGEQGSAKSTTARILKNLVDPSAAPLRSLPRSERDLMITAKNSRVIAFDNLSGIRPWLSDALCRLSTGGGFSTRGMYTDSDEIIFDAMRPMILNGIDDIANRQDLASRSIIVNLPRIPKEKRLLEQDLWSKFEMIKPNIFGGILDTVSFALRNLSNVKLQSLPRMADFAKWIIAAEPALPWEQGQFEQCYSKNQDESAQSAFEADIVAMAIREFVEKEVAWEGTATQLMGSLRESKQYEKYTEDRSWPRTPNYLSQKIRRVADSLRSAGIEVEDFRKSGRKLWKFISKEEDRVDV